MASFPVGARPRFYLGRESCRYAGAMIPVLLTNSEGRPGTGIAAGQLAAGTSALDAIEAGIRAVEADPEIRSVGFGGAPNITGVMECDASIMCGATLRTGAVGALQDYLHPITVARAVMERLPHVMLAGAGAARFAAEIGEPKQALLSDEARSDYEAWVRNNVPEELRSQWPDVPLAGLSWPRGDHLPPGGTTCFLARGRDGRWAGGVSTSGWACKYPGRLGDSPLIGAGLYVDDRYGAASCTGTGEMTVRAGTARAIIAWLKKGASIADACREAAMDLALMTSGFIGPVIVHGVDRNGTPCVLGVNLRRSASYWYWREDMPEPESMPVEPAT
jgi:beta-aspartyl-peptidase (threonine type)